MGFGSSLGLGEKEQNSETFVRFKEGDEEPKKSRDFGALSRDKSHRFLIGFSDKEERKGVEKK